MTPSEEVADRLAEDLIWRKRELSTLRNLVNTSSLDRRLVLGRSLVTVSYAHWEGFVRGATDSYIQFVGQYRLKYTELSSNLIALGLTPRIRNAVLEKSPEKLVEVVETIRGRTGERSNIKSLRVDWAESNLSSTVLKRIMASIGLDYHYFETKGVFLDRELLAVRNRIAHGEHWPLDPASTIELSEHVQALLEVYKNLVENAVATSTHYTPNTSAQ